MAEKAPKVGPLRNWREKRDAKRARTGPSADARQEQRNADKVFRPHGGRQERRKAVPAVEPPRGEHCQLELPLRMLAIAVTPPLADLRLRPDLDLERRDLQRVRGNLAVEEREPTPGSAPARRQEAGARAALRELLLLREAVA